MDSALVPPFVDAQSGSWHHGWCTDVLPEASPVETCDGRPPDGDWDGPTCEYCIDRE